MARRFAPFAHVADPRHEVSPSGLIPASFRRPAPYLHSHMLWPAGLEAAGPAPDRFAAPLHVVLGLADWIPAAIRDTLVP